MGNFVDEISMTPVWHVCTPGENQCVLFRDSGDYRCGMNIVGVTAAEFVGSVDVLTFELMSNHVHFVLRGDKTSVENFFAYFYRKLRRLFIRQERLSDIRNFIAEYYIVDSEHYLRSLIAYVNRNGYVANVNKILFSYEWGANRYFFTDIKSIESKVLLSTFSKNRKEEFFHTKDISFPDNYYLTNGYISPASYCKIEECESLYKSAHHYFSVVSKNVESFKDIAQIAGDKIFYTDEEIFSSCVHFAKKHFDKQKITMLDSNEKIELAKHLKFNFNASLKQISRLLKIEDTILNMLFPTAK